MKVTMNDYLEKAKSLCNDRTKNQKITLIGSIVIILFIIIFLFYIFLKPSYTQLYNNLSIEEVSQIKAELEGRDIPYEISSNGTAISVPKEHVDNLLVDLAGQGIPSRSGIDYSFFN